MSNMDPEDLHAENGSATRSLLQDYDEATATTPLIEPKSSFGSSVAFIGDVAAGVDDDDGVRNNGKTTKSPRISTMAYIILSMVLLLVCLFLAAVFMPQTVHDDILPTTLPSSAPSSSGQQRTNNHYSDKMQRQTDPTGVHISLTGSVSEMYVQFSTGDSGESIVEFAKKSSTADEPTNWIKVKGTSTTYSATDMCQEPATSLSGFVSPGHLHTVKLVNLEPNTDYIYRVGLGFGQGVKWSGESFHFRTSFPPGGGGGGGSGGQGESAVKFLVLADQGYSESMSHGSQQVAQLISSIINEQTIDSIHHIGDLCYADGTSSIWDAWLNMIQSYASHVPYMVVNGNHEYDHTMGGSGGKDPSGEESEFGFQPNWDETSFHSTGGECGVPISKRFAVPENGNSVFWYSYDQALMHTVVLSSEHIMTLGSRQYDWLEKDLTAVNRSITPWVVVELHRPLYSSDEWAEQVEVGIQDAIEDLLYTHRVDVVISGHAHSYFRSCDGLYTYNCAKGGPIYLIVGTGGESLEAVPTLQNHFTDYSDDTRFGVGRATVYNATVMHWEFVAVGGDITDEVWIRRDR